ncbi:hypothetical protein HH212_24805 [Massilia forsythiae]|uniref:Uncharacterized protein n=1 Tax=Massilia forsythiae TaxID=2728020 RepID=A0A7Z2ZV01_9BURK|nr:hypothetical protein [Massilia forsythiae]QJE02830.1 hypothetical protein HH212_24805 [Massilia forsythiae]
MIPARPALFSFLFVSWLFVTVLAAPIAVACPEKVPNGMSATSVADKVTVDGMALSILQVESREAMPAVLERLEKEWAEAGYAVRRNQAQGWNVLSALSEKCMTTLQLIDQGGSFGYLAVNRLKKPTSLRNPAPMPAGAKVLSTVTSEDDGRKGSTVLLESNQSVEDLVTFYKRRLTDDQWGSVRASGMMGRDQRFTGASVSAQRGRERIEVVIRREAGSKVVVNLAQEL